MRNIYFYFIILLVVISCSKQEIIVFEQNYDVKNKSENHVTIKDVYSIIERDFPKTKAENGLNNITITPYVTNITDTLMYIVNLPDGKGWKIYSSDKRTPAILAEGYSGTFSLNEGSPSVALWIECLAEDIANVKSASDFELTFTDEDIKYNKEYWSISQPLYIDRPLIEEYPAGHWEEEVFTQVEYRDSVEHLVAKWDQTAPYNSCCPYYVSTPDQRADVGCIAVAGAQVLHYLHYKLGVPNYMYSQCSCEGNVDGFNKYFSSPSIDIWDSMKYSYQYNENVSSIIPEAILASYVGMRVDMHYVDNIIGQYSWAFPQNLKSDLFEYYGISCIYDNYDEEAVINSLSNNMPVIISASNLLIPIDGLIHCFVIDGYRRKHTKYIHHHYYVVDDPTSGPYILPDEYTTYTYSSPVMTDIKINWGCNTQWSTTPLNDGWYSLTGDWTFVKNDSYTFNNNRKMIYNFAVSE